MTLDLFSSLSGLEHSLGYHAQRHEVLASNLANAETPGYQPLDLVREEAGDFASVLSRTDARHLTAGAEAAAPGTVIENGTAAAGGDGNGVRLERAMAELAANRVRYDAAIDLTRRRAAVLRYAAGNGVNS